MFTILLYAHIAFGATALLSGILAIIFRKGSKPHMQAGSIYYKSMYGVASLAIILSLMKFNPFLLAIAVFSFYLTYTGKQALIYWRLKQPYVPALRDKLPGYIGFITAVFMLLYPVYMIMVFKNNFSLVLAVFGSVLLLSSVREIITFRKNEMMEPRNKTWLLKHLGRMSGAYIATITAFLVNVVHFTPGWVLWVAPTVIGLIFIGVSLRKWKKKLKIDSK